MRFFNRYLFGLGLIAAMFLAVAMPAQTQNSRPVDESSDEAGLWYAVDKIEDKIKTSGIRLTDSKLNEYVQRVTCALTGPDCKNIRIYIIDAPYFNASMYPNGMMILNSGLLLRAENEAQMACVIGHEYGHFQQGHSLQRWRKAKDIANLSILVNLAGSAAGAGSETSIAGAIGGFMASQSFSRAHEHEADMIGFEVAAKAGYDARECSKVWTNIVSETQASEFRSVRRRAKGGLVPALSSHPVPEARAAYMNEFAQLNPGGELKGQQVHNDVTQTYYADWLRTELRAKDYARHIHLYETLKDRGRNGAIADYYIGEAYRLRKGEGDRSKAIAAWEASSKQAGAPPATWRALGEYYRRKKRKSEALQAYQKYIAAAPNAPDVKLINAYIDRLSAE